VKKGPVKRADRMSMNQRTADMAYMVVGILLLILLTGLWAYLWMH
jgi:hypothetical protein